MTKGRVARIPRSKHAGAGAYALEERRVMELALRVVQEIVMPESQGPREALAALTMAQKIVIMILQREQPHANVAEIIDEINEMVGRAQIHLFVTDSDPENPS